jgi:uncharacterized membrane protein
MRQNDLELGNRQIYSPKDFTPIVFTGFRPIFGGFGVFLRRPAISRGESGYTAPMISFLNVLRVVLKVLFGAFFVFGGLNHFRDPGFYLRMMPPWMPWHVGLVQATGILEILLGILFLVPRFTRPAAWGLMALLIAVFPANLHMALHPELFPEFNPVALWLRLPLQGVLIFWAWAYARTPSRPKHDRAKIPD